MTPQRPSIDQPEEGYYRTRMVRGGPWCGVKIWYAPKARGENQTPEWHCLVNGMQADVWETWPKVAGRQITEEEYQKILLQSQPNKPIDKMRTPPVF